ncbi:MAG: c-type cytochrome domain-containing protein, partial [Planctomycetota bacterium]
MLPGAPVLYIILLAHLSMAEEIPWKISTEKEEVAPLSYNQDIRPILSSKCFACHGPDSAARKAGLRLDNAEDAYLDRNGVAAVTPGDINNSLLVERILAEDPEDMMPPPDSHKHLDASERSVLLRWIEQGAEYEPHWAWTPPVQIGRAS